LIDDNKFYREQLSQSQQVLREQAQQTAALVRELAQLRHPQPSPPQTPPPPVPAVPAVPPRPEQFATHEEFLSAHASWHANEAVRQALAQRDAEEQTRRQSYEQQQAQQREQQRQQAWHSRMSEGRQQFTDFDMALSNPATSVHPSIQPILVETVLESPQGPAILHYLGTHPDVTQALNQLTPYAAARFLGEIEAHLRPQPKAAPPAPPPVPPATPPALPVTPVVLPAPLQPVGGGNAPAAPGTFKPGMSLRDYESMRTQERRRTA
jgi:hypothetical protein